jgi:hypothetical protein
MTTAERQKRVRIPKEPTRQFIIEDIAHPVIQNFGSVPDGSYVIMYREKPRKDGILFHGQNEWETTYDSTARKYNRRLLGFVPFIYRKEETNRTKISGMATNARRYYGSMWRGIEKLQFYSRSKGYIPPDTAVIVLSPEIVQKHQLARYTW